MFILGLTGGIGMGKSQTARLFRQLGVPVHDADEAVHTLYAAGGAAVAPVGEAFPGSVVGGIVERAKLSSLLVAEPGALARLESIVHPLVLLAEEQFLATEAARRTPIVVLDVPLLFETRRDSVTDAVAVVSAPADVQRARVARRPGMTQEKLEALLARQMPDVEKRAKADFIIETGAGVDYALHQVKRILGLVAEREPKAWRARQPIEERA
jgi:dephospho-CoA kinase